MGNSDKLRARVPTPLMMLLTLMQNIFSNTISRSNSKLYTLEISPGVGMTMVDLYLYGNIGTGGVLPLMVKAHYIK